MSTVAEITEAIEHLSAPERLQLLKTLPASLGATAEDFAWLRASESAFDFWNNAEDAVYDRL